MPEALPEAQSRGIQPASRLQAHAQRHFFIIRKQLLRTELLGSSSYHYQEIAFQTFIRQERSNCTIHGDKLSFLMHRKS
jgi:hypothetical protein